MNLDAQKIMSLHVELGEPRTVGRTPEGLLTIIPIIGGTFEGESLRGRVCCGGADWNVAVSETLAHVHAKYWIQTEDQEVISVENEGWIDLSREDAVIRTTPRFTCDLQGRYAFLASGTFAGELVGGGKDCVEITFYRLV